MQRAEWGTPGRACTEVVVVEGTEAEMGWERRTDRALCRSARPPWAGISGAPILDSLSHTPFLGSMRHPFSALPCVFTIATSRGQTPRAAGQGGARNTSLFPRACSLHYET